MDAPRPWMQWALMWGLLIGCWIGLQHWAPAPPWRSDVGTVRPLQPRVPALLGSTRHSPMLTHEGTDSAWAFLDTLDLEVPASWALTGSARAWYGLRRFFERLPRAKQQRIEVYHWGDSQIEGDRISSVLRSAWQSRWGGRGPGWVLPLTPAPQTAIVATLEDGDVVRRAGFGRGRQPEALRLPFLAVNEVLDSATWTVRGNGRASLTHKGWTWTDVWSEATAHVTLGPGLAGRSNDSLSWRHSPVMEDLTLSISPQELRGIFLGQTRGVYVHNLPLRGSSGTLFDKVPEADWAHMRETHPPALLLLQFGGNAVPGIQSAREARWFAQRLANNIRFLEQTFPGVPVVFIGPSDMGKSPDSYPGLPMVLDALAAEIPSTGALHWDLQSAMGGPGSMAEWVQRGWAASDHVHFTRRGAQEAGQRLEQALAAAWQSMRSLEAVEAPLKHPTTP